MLGGEKIFMKIDTEKNQLEVELNWWEKIVSFHGNFSIPFQNITSVSLGKPKQGGREARRLGIFIPGFIKSGTFHNDRGKEYWLWVRGSKPISVALKNEEFDIMILGVNDDQYWQMMIKSKVKREI